MKQMLKIELERAFRGSGFWLSLMIGMLISIIQYIQKVIPAVSDILLPMKDKLGIPVCVHQTWIAMGDGWYYTLFVRLIPLLAVIPYAVTYYTENGVVKYDIDDTYVPYKFDTSAFKVENADVTSGSAKVTVPTLPKAYDAEYAVEGLTNVSVENGTLKYNATGVKPGQYTLNVTDKSSKYVPFSTSFTLTTDNVVAVYNNNVKAPALVAAKDVQADDFANFVKNIQKVSVNGKEYAASGKGSVKLINEDGTLVTTADALKAEGTYNIVVTATGYNKTLEFTYTNKSDTTATKPSDATTATKPAATTTATKPAVKPVKKVTVKKQTAKVKAGKKKLTVTWKKDKNVSGYQIKIATKKNFKGAKTYTVKSYKTYKKVIKKLKAKKKYFVKVRAYKTVGKSKVYGAYSAVRSCKVK